jgi:DUF1680 family protein
MRRRIALPPRPLRFSLALRVPGWVRGQAVPGRLYAFSPSAESDAPAVQINGKGRSVDIGGSGVGQHGFARVDREWHAGDEVTLDMPMPVRRVIADEQVVDDRGRAAIQRGPIVYCLEGIDHQGTLAGLELPLESPLRFQRRADLLGGVGVVVGKGWRAAAPSSPVAELPVMAVPYFAWANRGKGEMAVWVPTGSRRPVPGARGRLPE